MRIVYGLRITLTIEKSQHRVKGKITLLTKLPGAFNTVTTDRDRGVGMVGCRFSTADAEFLFIVQIPSSLIDVRQIRYLPIYNPHAHPAYITENTYE